MKTILKHSCALGIFLALSACGGNPGNSAASSSSTSSSTSSSSSSSSASSSSSSSASSSSSSGGDGGALLVIAINTGGVAAIHAGVQYQADEFADGGTAHSTADRITGVADGALFQSERYGTFTYDIPVTEGVYDLQLHFAEIYHERAGQRILDVSVEDTPHVQRLDLYQAAGHDTAYSVKIAGVTVNDGYLSIAVEGIQGDGTLAGFAVYSADGKLATPTEPPVNVASAENTGADCEVPALPAPAQISKNTKFPDPFKKIDGARISKTSEWKCRRQEIHKQAEKYIYGQKPPKPAIVTGSVTRTKINVHAEHAGKAIDFSADVVLPSTGQGPFPAVINLGAKGGFGGITLGESRLLAQGVAVIYYNHYDLGREGTPEASRGKPNPGKFYDLYGGTHSAGLLMSWAWGASRLLDVLQAHGGDLLDPTAIGVTGCSRNGKGAFAVGVFDERVALTIPQETSTAGVPAYRIVDILNTERTDHNFYGLNWLSDDFEPFVLNASQLPIDSHSLVAMIAPRGLLVLDNPHQRQFSAPAGQAAVLAGAEVYKALGVQGNISYHSSVSDTAHCSYKNEYTELLTQNIAKFLKRTGTASGRIVVGSGGAGNLAEWKDWSTPSLEKDSGVSP